MPSILLEVRFEFRPKMLKVLLFLFVSIYSVYGKNEEYEGYALYEVKINSLDQVGQVHSITEELNVDVWSYGLPGREGLLLVSKDVKELFEERLQSLGVEYKINSANIKENIDLEERLLAEAQIRRNASSYSRFGNRLPLDTHRYDTVDQYLVDIANKYPSVASVVSGGKSVEGRDIKYLKISTTNFEDTSKPVVFMQSLLHAREWITLPVTLYAIQKLVEDAADQDLVNNIDWIIVPIANPDGYEFSHTDSRFWRKNRATSYGVCPGVDLNRNYDSKWGTESSSISCSDTFHGPGPFSEPETQVTRNILNEHGSRIALFLDIHSFGSMILFGFGDRSLPANALILNYVGVQMAQKIDSVKWPNNRDYRVGNIVDVIRYTASGGASDYAQLMIGWNLSYTFELPAYRNTQSIFGFLVDPDFIDQAAYETWEGIKVGARYVART